MHRTAFRAAVCATAALTLAGATAALAQDYPTRPVRLVIPFPPGGSNDVVGRMVATKLGERLGKQMVVENRGGAGGVVGTEAVTNTPPDGYTLLVVSLAHAVNPWLYKLKYDPLKSFTPIALIGSGPNVLAVTPGLPVKSVKELIAHAKANPGKLNMAHAGVGSFQHLGSSLFLLLTKLDIVQVPFKGGGPAMIDVIAGHSQVTMGSLVQTTGHIRSGKLRALGVGGKKRVAILPDLPTIDEAGVPGYEATNWWGIVAPAGLPKAIVDKLAADVSAVQDTADLKEAFAKQGAEVAKMGPADFTKFIGSELVKWEKVVREAKITAK
jgi:tripartite-type tricarboxylate transporter receptor subunit TctC